MNYRILQHEHPSPAALAAVASLWNNNAAGRHDFFPWTAERLAALLVPDGYPVGTLFTAHFGAHADGGAPENDGSTASCAAFVHVNQVREDGYAHAGVVENILVDARHRRRGLGTELLRHALERIAAFRPRPALVDAMGAWPFGYAFNTLADGSERSGVFLNDPALYRLFRKSGFEPVRKSIVMRVSLHNAPSRPAPPGASFYIGRRSQNTWLDRVFRGRELWDHELIQKDKRILSRAIFGFMEAESKQEGSAVFSVFGVNTAADLQGNGYAGINIANMMQYVRTLGGDVMELHVYADNTPALRLYRSLGFKPLAETMMLHKPL